MRRVRSGRGGSQAAADGFRLWPQPVHDLRAGPADDSVIRIDADPAGAAHLMQAVLAYDGLSARLVEEDGHWSVRVPLGPGAGRVIAAVHDAVTLCIDERRAAFASIRLGDRAYTWHAAAERPAGELGSASASAA